MALRMTMGIPVPGRVTRTTLALYPLAVRRVRDFVISFLQIPPRDGHPCLDGWFRSLRSIGDSHPLNATSYSTHQARRPVPLTRISGRADGLARRGACHQAAVLDYEHAAHQNVMNSRRW